MDDVLKLAFCLYKYFPYGGLQRDFLRIALECQSRGYQIRVFVLSWIGEIPEGFDVTIVPVEALTNHTRYQRYSIWVEDAIRKSPVDCVVGINKMPGLDVYYAADSCYEEKARSQRSWIYRLLPRYKHFADFERAVFDQHASTEVLMISSVQQPFFKQYYQTPESRLHFLPPGITRDRIAPDNAALLRRKKRAELGVHDDEHLVLMVGSGFIKKGLSRALYAIKSLPLVLRRKTRFFVVGEDKQAPFRRLAWFLGIREQVTFLAGRDDVPEIMLAGDMLLHPATDEAAGIVLLEAVVAGLPVLATDVCGYGHYIEEADVGELVPSPFDQVRLNESLLQMLESARADEWRSNGKRFASEANIYSLPQEAARIISQVAQGQLETCPKIGLKNEGILAFCLFKYFPYGGLQRDFIRIALTCEARGYKIRVYCLTWEGEMPPAFEVIIVPASAMTNHKKYERYAEWVHKHLATQPVKGVVGFNKMPGLDVYYAADSCYEEKAQTQRGQLYRAIPRYRHFSSFERAVFKADTDTEILLIAEAQKPLFRKYYGTPDEKFHILPPGISRDRMAPSDAEALAIELRDEFGLAADEKLLLMIGSGFITKGLDRILLGMSSLAEPLRSKTRLIAIGQDNPNAFLRMAQRLDLADQVVILSGRDDIPRFLLGADLLVHPAYTENTGTVLLEALIAGLPVLASDVCGYAHYITDADAGRLVESPYQQQRFDTLLSEMLESEEQVTWKRNGIRFGHSADIYSMHDHAVEVICESIG